MSMQAGLKAGGIGAAVMIVLALLGLIPIPFLGCLCCLLAFAAMIGAGVMAARYTPAPRTSGGAAGAGAIAGLLSGLGYGLVNAIVAVVRGASGAASIPPEVMQQLEQASGDPQTFSSVFSFMASTGGAAVTGSLCCIGALLLGAALGAVGGAIGAAIFKQN